MNKRSKIYNIINTIVMLWQVKNFELDLLLGISLISPMILLLSNNNWVWKLYELPSSSQITKLCRFWRPTLFLLLYENMRPNRKFAKLKTSWKNSSLAFFTRWDNIVIESTSVKKGAFFAQDRRLDVVIIVSYQWSELWFKNQQWDFYH